MPLPTGTRRGALRALTATVVPALVLGTCAVATASPASTAGAGNHTVHGSSYNPQGQTPVTAHAATAAANAPITRGEVYDRAQSWVSVNVPYSQSTYRNAPDSPTGPYRTDCSGFVSMAWGLNQSLTTQTLPHVATQISKDDLRIGDVLDYNSTRDAVNGSHVIMFVRWANTAHTSFVEDEEAGGGLGAVERTVPFPYDTQMDGTGSWTPYRYNNITDGPAVSPYQAAVQVKTSFLFLRGNLSNAQNTYGMMPGTSPSITKLAGGGFETAFVANNGHLWVTGTAGSYDTQFGVHPGTSPAIASTTDGGYQIAFISPQGELWTTNGQTGNGGTLHLGAWINSTGRSPSPAITGLSAGGYQIAFVANTGTLWTAGTQGNHDWNDGVDLTSSPSITAVADSYDVAINTGGQNNFTWVVGHDNKNWQTGAMTGTSPSITALPTGGYEFAIQANNGFLFTVGPDGINGNQYGMAPGTSPAIAAVPGGYDIALHSNTHDLFIVGHDFHDWQLGLPTDTDPGSPTIA